MAHRSIAALALLCLLLSSCSWFPLAAPPDENALFNEQMRWTWGEGGAYCQMSFGDRVDPNAVTYDPEFLRPYEGAGQNLEIEPKGKHVSDLKLIVNKDADDRSR